MVDPGQSSVIFALSLAGAIGQAAVTVRWYEPPEMDGRDPNPLFEAGLFFVVFGLIFTLIGFVVSSVAPIAPPYTTIATFVLVPIGGFMVYAPLADLTLTDDRATALMQCVAGLVVGVYPIALFVV